MMAMCWHKNSKARPTFIEIIEMLLPDVNPKFHTLSYYHTQRLVTNSIDIEEADTPNTPLRSSAHDESLSADSNQTFRYFPSATVIPEDGNMNGDGPVTANDTDGPVAALDAGPAVGDVATGLNSNEGSKAISINYSEGSKGSKISTYSNGSVSNGHVVYACNKKGN